MTAAQASMMMEGTFEECTDGMDNDGNGYTDCGDYSCSRSEDMVLAFLKLVRNHLRKMQ